MKYENLVLSNELIKVELQPLKIWNAHVSSVSPSSKRMEELWELLVFIRVWRSFAVGGNMVTYNNNLYRIHLLFFDSSNL